MIDKYEITKNNKILVKFIIMWIVELFTIQKSKNYRSNYIDLRDIIDNVILPIKDDYLETARNIR